MGCTRLKTSKIISNTSLKKHETITDDPPVKIYLNKIKNRIAFKIKTGYKLKLLSEETMKLLGSSKEDKDEILPKLEAVDIVLMHFNTYQQASKVLFTLDQKNKFGQLITIDPQSLTMLNTTNAEFSFIEIWFKNQSNSHLKKKIM